MKRWHALHTLAIVYRDAFNNQLNDRYQAKWQRVSASWRRDARDADDQYRDRAGDDSDSAGAGAGVGHRGGTVPADVYYVQVTWVSATGQEGAPSLATTTRLRRTA